MDSAASQDVYDDYIAATDKSRNDPTFPPDIWPERPLSKSFCLKQLTSYEVHTTIPRNSWSRVKIQYKEVIRRIRGLDAGRRSIADKEASLDPYQRTQVINLVNSKTTNEHEDQCFEWTLAQLHCEESKHPETEQKVITSITVYLKRVPLPGIDVIDLYRKCRDRATNETAMTLHVQRARQIKMEQLHEQMRGSHYMDQGKQGISIADKPTMPITSKHNVAPQNHDNQEPYGSVPLPSAYDFIYQDQRNTAIGDWTLRERLNFPMLIKHYGTDWHGIAKWMGTKTHIMVCSLSFATYNAV
jgi:hypothetical protein